MSLEGTLGGEQVLTIAGAIEATVALQFLVAPGRPDLLGLAPEVIDAAVLVGQKLACRDENVVDAHAHACVRHVQGVVEDLVRLVVGESIQVPVGMAAQHNGRLLGRRLGHHLEVPVPPVQGIRDDGGDFSGEALLSIGVNKGECDAVVGVRDDGEVAPVPAIGAAVQGVHALGICHGRVLVGLDLVLYAVDLKGGVLDAIGIAARHSTKVRVLFVLAVVRGVVEAGDNVALDAIAVLDNEVGDGRSVGNEGGRDAIAVDPVLAILVRLGGLVGVGVGVGVGKRHGDGEGREGQEPCSPLHDEAIKA